MQFADDADIAAVVTASTRNFGVSVVADWNRDGNYDHPYSDLSPLIEEARLERMLHGALPAEVSLVEGYASTELVLTLSGRRATDELDAMQLFSAYRTDSPFYAMALEGCHIHYDVIAYTSAGPRYIRQFSGRVRRIWDDRTRGTVTITCLDLAEALRNPISLPRWAAVDSTLEYATDSVEPAETSLFGTVNSSWLVDAVLRKNGGGIGPGANAGCLFSVTFNGGSIPEVGDLRSAGVKVPGVGGIGTWMDGPPLIGGLAPLAADSPYSNQIYNTYAQGYLNAPLDMSGAAVGVGNVRTLAFGGWIYGDASNPHLNTNSLIFVALGEDAVDDNARFVALQDPSGTVKARLTVDMGAWSGVWETGDLAAGWHYVAFAIESRTTGVTVKVNIDGVLSTPTATSGPSAGALPAVTQSTRSGLNICQMQVTIPCSHLQVWSQDVATTGLTFFDVHQNEDLRSTIDIGLNELNHLPDIYERQAWSVLEAVAAAEYAVVVADEHGRVQFLNHDTVRQAATETLRTLTADDFSTIGLGSTVDSVRNTIKYSTTPAGYREGSVWQAPAKDSLTTSPGVERALRFPLTDVMWVQHGDPGAITNVKASVADNWYDEGGWAVTDPSDTAWNLPGANNVFSSVFPLGYLQNRFVQININNASARTVQFTFNDLYQPAYSILGYKIYEGDPIASSVTDTASRTRYGPRTLDVTESPYHQNAVAVGAIMTKLLAELSYAKPTISDITVPADPRVQLRDAFQIDDDQGLGRELLVSVTKITRTYTASEDPTDGGGLIDTYGLELLNPPGRWLLGSEVYSVLGETTIL